MASNVPAEAQPLGTPVAEYTPGPRSQKANLIGSVVLIVFGLGGILLGIYLASLYGSGQLCFSVAGLISCLLGVLWFVLSKRQSDLRVLVFPEGLSYTKRGKTDIIRWDDVATVKQNITRHQQGGTTHVYTVQLTDGRKHTFSDGLAGVQNLGNTIQQEVTRRILPRAVEAYGAGETIPFGKVSISKDGITRGKETLSWDQIKGVKLDRGVISIKKEAKWLRWSSVRVAETPNVFVLLAIVDRIVGINKEE